MMKKFLFSFLACLSVIEGFTQLEVSAEMGLMRSISRFDSRDDPENSMRPMPVNVSTESIHITHEIGNYFYAGIHVAYQSQKSGVAYNMDYYNSQEITSYFYEGTFTHAPSREFRPLKKYLMLGPEWNARFRVSSGIEIETGISLLFYDNRQVLESFEGGLKTQMNNKNDQYTWWHNDIYAYRRDTEFLNGWNMKVNGNFKILISPFRSRAHTLFLGFAAGRSIKQNYAVNFRTNKPNSETETNVLRVSNYGGYYAISLGYIYLYDFRPRP